jgi:uncharacterized membrane protein required for colicin V production
MWMNGVVILILILSGYLWLTRGFFSALVHMLCVIVAGALAFAFWEPLAYWMLGSVKASSSLQGVAWGVALVIPFALALSVLRLGIDKLLPSNVQLDTVTNYVGGGVCGLISGVITAGVVVLGVGLLRLPSDHWDYKPVDYTPSALGRGGLQRSGRLLVPVDRITSGLYARLSTNAFRTGEPLAKWYPDLDLVGPSMRINHGEGKARNTMGPKDFSVIGHYVVSGSSALAVMSDSRDAAEQKVVDLEGNRVDFKPGPQAPRIEGFMLKFGPGAKEKNGQVVLTNGQVRLVVQNTQDESEFKTVHAIAVVTTPRPPDPVTDPTGRLVPAPTPGPSRFRFDSNNFAIASVPGQSDAAMSFEFLVPAGFEPIALYIKNVRHELDPAVEKPRKFTTASMRDAWIRNNLDKGTPPGGADSGPQGTAVDLKTDQATRIAIKLGAPGAPVSNIPEAGLTISSAIGYVLQKGSERNLEVGEGNRVVDGEETYTKAELQNRGLDRQLRVDRFEVPEDSVLVQLDVGANRPASLIQPSVQSADLAAPPVLVDNKGLSYQAVGYIYSDESTIRIRYTRGRPLAGLQDLSSRGITLSQSRDDQKLVLIFVCSLRSELTGFAIGDKAINLYEPPVPLNTPQK